LDLEEVVARSEAADLVEAAQQRTLARLARAGDGAVDIGESSLVPDHRRTLRTGAVTPVGVRAASGRCRPGVIRLLVLASGATDR
jgi:hypothetical protein